MLAVYCIGLALWTLVRHTIAYVIRNSALTIRLLSNTVYKGDASGRHDGRWNLLSFVGRQSVLFTRSIGAKCCGSLSFKRTLCFLIDIKMLQDGICDTADILNSVPTKKVFMMSFSFHCKPSCQSYLTIDNA